MCFSTCSTLRSSSFGIFGRSGSPAASTAAPRHGGSPASSASAGLDLGVVLLLLLALRLLLVAASLMISRTRILPLRSRSPRSRISRIAMLDESTAARTSFSPSSMRFAISTSPSRVRRDTEPILRRYMRTGSLDLP